MMVGNHLKLKCLEMIVYGQWGQRMEAKICVLFLILGTLMILPWFALSMTYDDDDFICGKECVGIMDWWVFIDIMLWLGIF